MAGVVEHVPGVLLSPRPHKDYRCASSKQHSLEHGAAKQPPCSRWGHTSLWGRLSTPSACQGSRAEPSAALISGMGGRHEQGWSSMCASSHLSLVFSAASTTSLSGNTLGWGTLVAGLLLQRLYPNAAQTLSEASCDIRVRTRHLVLVTPQLHSKFFLDVASQCLFYAGDALQPAGNPPTPEAAMPPCSTVLLRGTTYTYGHVTCSRGLPASHFKPCVIL